MTKTIFLAIMLFSALSLQAQDVKFGMRGGPNFTVFGGEGQGYGTKMRIGLHVGGFVSFPISESLSFEPGIQFATKGAKTVTDVISLPPLPSVERNSYIDLPLLFNLRTGGKFYFLAGAQPSIRISSAFVYKDGSEYITINRGKFFGDQWKEFDLAGVIGLGIELGQGLHLQTTYEHGFTNVSEIYDSVYNRGFKLTLGKTF